MKILKIKEELDFRDEIFYEKAYHENIPFTGIQMRFGYQRV